MSEDNQKTTKFDAAASKLRSVTSGALRLTVIILFAVVAWRIAWSNFSLDLSKFDFTDLLAMILALFAMGMSVAFYFKSTDSSNQFYDNIYNFTQKTSEILGRIEERFGERLKHLDEGYGRMQSQFDGIAKTPGEIEKEVKETEGKEEQEKEKLEEAKKAMQEMMETLAEKAKLQQKEKEEFYQKMGELATERDLAQQKLRELEEDRDGMRQQLHMMERDMMEDPELHNPIVMEILRHPEIRHLLRDGTPARIIRRQAQRLFSEMPIQFLKQLREAGIINENNELTTAGGLMLRSMSRRYR